TSRRHLERSAHQRRAQMMSDACKPRRREGHQVRLFRLYRFVTFVISWLAAATVTLGTPAAAPQTTTPCVGDDCQNLHAQLAATAAGIDRSKTQFVSAVRRL